MVEIAAGILVAAQPRLGGYVVALWLAGTTLDLVTLGDFHDIALRDFGLLVGALALARLGTPGLTLGSAADSAADSAPGPAPDFGRR